MGDSYVAYDNEKSTLHELNETAYLIMSGLVKKKTKAEIVGDIIKKFKVSREDAKKDMQKFVQLLEKRDLVVCKR